METNQKVIADLYLAVERLADAVADEPGIARANPLDALVCSLCHEDLARQLGNRLLLFREFKIHAAPDGRKSGSLKPSSSS